VPSIRDPFAFLSASFGLADVMQESCGEKLQPAPGRQFSPPLGIYKRLDDHSRVYPDITLGVMNSILSRSAELSYPRKSLIYSAPIEMPFWFLGQKIGNIKG
jgi:hypothetical protein